MYLCCQRGGFLRTCVLTPQGLSGEEVLDELRPTVLYWSAVTEMLLAVSHFDFQLYQVIRQSCILSLSLSLAMCFHCCTFIVIQMTVEQTHDTNAFPSHIIAYVEMCKKCIYRGGHIRTLQRLPYFVSTTKFTNILITPCSYLLTTSTTSLSFKKKSLLST